MDDIFESVLGGLLFAWILTWFKVDKMLIEVLQPFIEITLTKSTYYCFFVLLGIIIGFIKVIKSR